MTHQLPLQVMSPTTTTLARSEDVSMEDSPARRLDSLGIITSQAKQDSPSVKTRVRSIDKRSHSSSGVRYRPYGPVAASKRIRSATGGAAESVPIPDSPSKEQMSSCQIEWKGFFQVFGASTGSVRFRVGGRLWSARFSAGRCLSRLGHAPERRLPDPAAPRF